MATKPKYQTSKSGYIRYYEGNSPLVISVPHGGDLRPKELPQRTADPEIRSFCVDPDHNTIDLAEQLVQLLPQSSFVIALLERTYCDFNRSSADAYPVDSDTRFAYEEYHGLIRQALDAAVNAFGFAILVDLHGQSHRPVTEIGYCVGKDTLLTDFMQPDRQVLNALTTTSLEPLRHRNKQRLADLIKGPTSFGAILANHGFLSVPSPLLPHPEIHPHSDSSLPFSYQSKDGLFVSTISSSTTTTSTTTLDHHHSHNPFYSGGFTTRSYHSVSPCILVLQFETARHLRHEPTITVQFCQSLAASFAVFLKVHFEYSADI